MAPVFGACVVGITKYTRHDCNELCLAYSFVCILSTVGPIAFNAVFTLSRYSFYGQLLERLNVASLSRPTVFFFTDTHCYCYTLGK